MKYRTARSKTAKDAAVKSARPVALERQPAGSKRDKISFQVARKMGYEAGAGVRRDPQKCGSEQASEHLVHTFRTGKYAVMAGMEKPKNIHPELYGG